MRSRGRVAQGLIRACPPGSACTLGRTVHHREGQIGVSTAVVTGGAGFLGSHLCEYLLAREWRVICLDFIDVDEPVDAVFHLASPASPVDYLRLPLHTLKVGSYGTHNALGLAKFKRARFLLASTSEVYGDPEVHPQREEYWGNVNPVGPRGVYDEAKRYAEAMTMAYHRQQGRSEERRVG